MERRRIFAAVRHLAWVWQWGHDQLDGDICKLYSVKRASRKKQQLVNLRLLFRRQAFVCHMSVESFGWMHDSEHTISGSSGRLSDTSQQNRTRPMLRHTATFFYSCWSQSQTRQPNIILPPRATFPWSCQCFTLTQLHSQIVFLQMYSHNGKSFDVNLAVHAWWINLGSIQDMLREMIEQKNQ